MDLTMRPEVADTYPVFKIEFPDDLGLAGLAEKSSVIILSMICVRILTISCHYTEKLILSHKTGAHMIVKLQI